MLFITMYTKIKIIDNEFRHVTDSLLYIHRLVRQKEQGDLTQDIRDRTQTKKLHFNRTLFLVFVWIKICFQNRYVNKKISF